MDPVRFFQASKNLATLTLNRPERSNALSSALLRDFTQRLGQIESDPDLRVLLLEAEGRNFCGGLDLEEASQSEEKARSMPSLVVEILVKLRRLPQIVVAVVQGAARAGGGAIVAASDLVVAADSFNIAFPEVHRGLDPILLFPLLRRKLSVSALSELLLSGRPVDARRAMQLGLVHRVVEAGHERRTALEWIDEILAADPRAVRTAKELIFVQETSTAGCSLEDEFSQSLENHLVSWHSPSCREGVSAFLEKKNKKSPSLSNKNDNF